MADIQPKYDSQHERWLKYGVNVLIACVVVILLAGVVTYLAQKTGRRMDTTESRVYSLKPQTVAILNDIKTKTKLVSLYRSEIPEKGVMKKSPYAEAVADMLEEYRRDSGKIEIDVIDPVQNNAKVESLIEEVSAKYGGEVKKYEAVVNSYSKNYEAIKKLASAEVEKVAKLPTDKFPKDEEGQNEQAAVNSAQTVLRQVTNSDTRIKKSKEEKPPDYRGITDELSQRTGAIAELSKQVVEILGRGKDDARLPAEIRKYMADAPTAYNEIIKLAEELNKQTKDLGTLKLDDLRTSLKQKDTILVIGESDMRVIPFDQVWKIDEREIRQRQPGQEMKPKFAGERQISTAILALNQNKKQKVAFVRNGGAPLTAAGGMFGRGGGPMAEIAARLREYNFDVMEKDLTGMWAMQAQMQQMPAEPEPSDEQIKDAIWIVLNFPNEQQQPGMPTPSMMPKVQDHLNGGGSAMIIFAPRADNMTELMKSWGIEPHADAIAVHSTIKTGEGRQGDMLEEAQKYPFVFSIRDYGDHPITKPLRSLDSLLLPLMVVKPTTTPAAGVKTTPIIPVPPSPDAWGETDIESIQSSQPVFDKAKDIEAPIFGGMVAEKEKAGRLVVIMSPTFAIDQYLNEPDPQLLRQGIIASRFPANAELFSNSVFWLAKMEPMIAISPAAMEVARIEPMTETQKNVWKVGVLLIGLPGLVVLIGAAVWFMRQD